MKCTTSGSDFSCVNGTRSSLSSLSTLFSSSISFVHRSISLSLERSANQLSSAHRTKGLSLTGGEGRLWEQDLIDDLDYAVARPHVALDDGGVAGTAQHGLGIGTGHADGEPKGIVGVLDLGGAHPKILSLKSGDGLTVDEGLERQHDSRHVVLEDLCQEVLVGQDLLRGHVLSSKELLKRSVGGREDGDLLGHVVEGAGEIGGLEGGHQGGEVWHGRCGLDQGGGGAGVDASVDALVVLAGRGLSGGRGDSDLIARWHFLSGSVGGWHRQGWHLLSSPPRIVPSLSPPPSPPPSLDLTPPSPPLP